MMLRDSGLLFRATLYSDCHNVTAPYYLLLLLIVRCGIQFISVQFNFRVSVNLRR